MTCRLHEVDPYTYLVDVLQRISVHPATRAIELTPRMWKSLFAVDEHQHVGALADLRHSWASIAAMNGVDMVTIAKLLGHALVETTERVQPDRVSIIAASECFATPRASKLSSSSQRRRTVRTSGHSSARIEYHAVSRLSPL